MGQPITVDYKSGAGGISHLVPEMFKKATGLFMVHIPSQVERSGSGFWG